MTCVKELNYKPDQQCSVEDGSVVVLFDLIKLSASVFLDMISVITAWSINLIIVEDNVEIHWCEHFESLFDLCR